MPEKLFVPPRDMPSRGTFEKIDKFFAHGAEAVRIEYDHGRDAYHLKSLDQNGLDQFRSTFPAATPSSFLITSDLADYSELIGRLVAERKLMVIAPLEGLKVRVYNCHPEW